VPRLLRTPLRLSAGVRDELEAAGVRVRPVEDHRPAEAYVTFRCWDPDATEIEIFFER
jgi:hypothetical protein